MECLQDLSTLALNLKDVTSGLIFFSLSLGSMIPVVLSFWLDPKGPKDQDCTRWA